MNGGAATTAGKHLEALRVRVIVIGNRLQSDKMDRYPMQIMVRGTGNLIELTDGKCKSNPKMIGSLVRATTTASFFTSPIPMPEKI